MLFGMFCKRIYAGSSELREPVWGLWTGRYAVTVANEHAVQLAEFVLCVHWKCLSTTSCWSSGHTKLSIPQECLPKLSAVATDDRKLACYCCALSLFLSDLLSIAPLLLLLVTLLPVLSFKKKQKKKTFAHQRIKAKSVMCQHDLAAML